MNNGAMRVVMGQIKSIEKQIDDSKKDEAAQKQQKAKDDAFGAKLNAFKDRLAREEAAAKRRLKI